MRITVTQYAKSLYEATKDKSQGEIEGVLANFVKILGKNNQLKLESDIIKKFGEIYNKENSIIEVKVTSRVKMSEESRDKVRTYVSNKYGAKEVVIDEKIDKNIKGGIIMQIGDEIVDGSVNRQLANLKKNLKK